MHMYQAEREVSYLNTCLMVVCRVCWNRWWLNRPWRMISLPFWLTEGNVSWWQLWKNKYSSISTPNITDQHQISPQQTCGMLSLCWALQFVIIHKYGSHFRTQFASQHNTNILFTFRQLNMLNLLFFFDHFNFKHTILTSFQIDIKHTDSIYTDQ